MKCRWISAACIAATAVGLIASPAAAVLATCAVYVTPTAGGGLSVRFTGTANATQGRYGFNLWSGSISGLRSDGSSITYSFTATTRTVDLTAVVASHGAPYGQVHVELDLAGATQYLACRAGADAAWTPVGTVVVPTVLA